MLPHLFYNNSVTLLSFTPDDLPKFKIFLHNLFQVSPV